MDLNGMTSKKKKKKILSPKQNFSLQSKQESHFTDIKLVPVSRIYIGAGQKLEIKLEIFGSFIFAISESERINPDPVLIICP